LKFSPRKRAMTKKSDNKNNISYFIKHQLQHLRTNRNLSEEQAAVKTGVSLKEYIAIEQSSKRITSEILAQLALAFDIEVRELLPSVLDLKKTHTEK